MKFRVFSRQLCCLLCVIACAACAHRHKGTQLPIHPLIGTIVLVNDRLGFVMIDTGNAYGIPMKGQALKSFTNGQESGVLTVSPEHKPPFLIADIVKGTPQKGDLVFE